MSRLHACILCVLYAQGDRLEGDNAYFCEDCGRKVDALKRTALAELPDSLMISLKRFDLDYTTMEVRRRGIVRLSNE